MLVLRLTVVAVTLAVPLSALAAPGPVAVGSGIPPDSDPCLAALREGLTELGNQEGP